MLISYAGLIFEERGVGGFSRKHPHGTEIGLTGRSHGANPVPSANNANVKIEAGVGGAKDLDAGYDNQEEALANFFELEDEWLASDNYAPFNALSNSKAGSSRSSILEVYRAQKPHAEFDFYRQNLKGYLHGFAGDFYVRMLWTFNQLKSFDGFIQASLAEYGFDKIYPLGVDPYYGEMNRGNDRSFSDEEIEASLMASGQQSRITDIRELKFFTILGLLNLDNFLYGMLIIFLVSIVHKLLNFKRK